MYSIYQESRLIISTNFASLLQKVFSITCNLMIMQWNQLLQENKNNLEPQLKCKLNLLIVIKILMKSKLIGGKKRQKSVLRKTSQKILIAQPRVRRSFFGPGIKLERLQKGLNKQYHSKNMKEKRKQSIRSFMSHLALIISFGLACKFQ